MLAIPLSIALACWCWFGRGPHFLRWPALLMVVVFTSGHPLAVMLGPQIEQLAPPLLALLVAGFGVSIILRGLFGHPGRHHYQQSHQGHHGRYGRRW